MEVEGVVAFLEIVELFKNRDRNNDVVLTKLVNTATVVEDYIGIEDEYFFSRSLSFMGWSFFYNQVRFSAPFQARVVLLT